MKLKILKKIKLKSTLGGKTYYGLTDRDEQVLLLLKQTTDRPYRHMINLILRLCLHDSNFVSLPAVEVKYTKMAKISKHIRDAISFYAKQNKRTVVDLTAAMIFNFFNNINLDQFKKELDRWSDLIPSIKPQ